jgi:hypothetical protein
MNIDANSLSARHGFSVSAINAAIQSLNNGGGSIAQFSHPEFGGMGQWMPGMIMIGDMFNSYLKGRVDNLFCELANEYRNGNLAPAPSAYGGPQQSPSNWWPPEFGHPSTSGGQNNVRYAYFPHVARLVVDVGGQQTIYDTGNHSIGGVSQQQSGPMGNMVFTSQYGTVPLSSLRVIG